MSIATTAKFRQSLPEETDSLLTFNALEDSFSDLEKISQNVLYHMEDVRVYSQSAS